MTTETATPCPTPKKVAYESALAANAMLLRLWKAYERGDHDRHERSSYQCPCGSWHLTSRPSPKEKK